MHFFSNENIASFAISDWIEISREATKEIEVLLVKILFENVDILISKINLPKFFGQNFSNPAEKSMGLRILYVILFSSEIFQTLMLAFASEYSD